MTSTDKPILFKFDSFAVDLREVQAVEKKSTADLYSFSIYLFGRRTVLHFDSPSAAEKGHSDFLIAWTRCKCWKD